MPAEGPDICGECVRFLDPPLTDGVHGEPYTCNPLGTKWRLLRRADQTACRSVHAIRRAQGDAWSQGEMTL